MLWLVLFIYIVYCIYRTYNICVWLFAVNLSCSYSERYFGIGFILKDKYASQSLCCGIVMRPHFPDSILAAWYIISTYLKYCTCNSFPQDTKLSIVILISSICKCCSLKWFSANIGHLSAGIRVQQRIVVLLL